MHHGPDQAFRLVYACFLAGDFLVTIWLCLSPSRRASGFENAIFSLCSCVYLRRSQIVRILTERLVRLALYSARRVWVANARWCTPHANGSVRSGRGMFALVVCVCREPCEPYARTRPDWCAVLYSPRICHAVCSPMFAVCVAAHYQATRVEPKHS